MMNNTNNTVIVNRNLLESNNPKLVSSVPDENGNLMIFGNLKIIDKTTKEILVNKRV